MPPSAKSPPPSPSAARRYTSPPPASPPRASLTKVAAPATPDKKAAPASPSTPAKKGDPSSPVAAKNGTEKVPEETAVDLPPPKVTGDIDEEVFAQITEMDDEDPDCEFSREIVVDYFKQAETTFDELRKALDKKDLSTLSAKGHFLKGSSAALGIIKVQDSCEHIQHYGAKRDEIKGVDITPDDALKRIRAMMPRLERDYKLAEAWLRDYYSKLGIELETDVNAKDD
ncbi:histidine-phosphotransfer domain, HPT domain-containing protein [Ceratobasidium sp. AG-I]|nr:histidine-phosphotransfer domain, HPT domain-containing protein [Ceratobasidium sp. AG-I]